MEHMELVMRTITQEPVTPDIVKIPVQPAVSMVGTVVTMGPIARFARLAPVQVLKGNVLQQVHRIAVPPEQVLLRKSQQSPYQ